MVRTYYHKAIHDFEARTGKPAFTQVPGNMTFRQYFDRMTDQQKRDWLGRAKFEMWKSGRYDVKDFIPPYPDKAMTVKQLKASDKESFNAPKKTKEEQRQENLAHRQEQRQLAYENRLNRWREQMKSVGLKNEAAEEFVKQYTPEAASFGKPPKIVSAPNSKTHLSKDGTELIIGRDAKTVKDALVHLENLPHKLKRGAQYRAAKFNRAKQEADLIGAKMIRHPHTAEMDLKATNPKFENTKDGIYSNNCQRCVTAYEARRRGIDVEAYPKDIPGDPLSRSKGWADAYKNGRIIKCSSNSGINARKNVIDAIDKMPDGSRCAVQVIWRNKKSGHVFIAEKINGQISFVDPQAHGLARQLDCDYYFANASGRECFIMRLDNLKFSDIVRQCCGGK